MSLRVVEQPQARKDFWEIVHYLALKSVATAERFMKAVEDSQEFLAEFPVTGTLIEDDEFGLKEIRITQVTGFENYLIVFRSRANRVEILRYTHGSRDLNSLLQGI